ncbi:MAG: hypothetical protein ACD_58C00238G0001 [uncultured bacterium]|nr:MAG: hypothetical protein ACD_58C00238G0001 [uncultured bacterium]
MAYEQFNSVKKKPSTQLKNVLDFNAIKLSLASPEKILEWSHGEVLKPETINYRTQKPERDGLFCEKIFGPTKDWECYCGKYKKIRYKGIICDKCGVEVTRSAVRRERLGHIDLSAPVAHIWYIHGVPSIIGSVLDLSVTDLEKVIYFAAFVILDINQDIKDQSLLALEAEYHELKKSQKTPEEQQTLDSTYKQVKSEIDGLKINKIISEAKFHEISMKYGQIIKVSIGAEAILELLKRLDLKTQIEKIRADVENEVGAEKRKNLKRLRMLIDMHNANILPEWLILSRLPVIPPDLRPMVQLDGGRFATSDLNDLYRRVINRNNRLKKLINQGAPEVICRNEKRMLQEAVDALIDNSARRGRVATTGTQRKLRSLSDMLRGKQGRFRQNLLGKRVDYSGRSVIVVGPELKLHQCGLPKVMALELFKPFVISKLISEGHIHNVKNATKLIEKGVPEVWDILERVTKDSYVMLNRAPTLHRLGIQAFQPVLIEGKAIQLHPLVCMAFNADFDGDQMAVHIPLSEQARYEASHIMRSASNLLKPASGEPIVTPRLDMVIGCFYLTSFEDGVYGENKIFMSKNEAIYAYQMKYVHTRAKIKVRMSPKFGLSEELVETSVGRLLFNNIIPKEMRFINKTLDSKVLKAIVSECFHKFGIDETANLVDKIKKIGFDHATLSGMTISMDDLHVPSNKEEIIKKADLTVDELDKQYRRGLITDEEKGVKAIELWMRVVKQIEGEMLDQFDKNSPVYMMVTSGARGSKTQLTQMAGIKGLMVNPSGSIIEVPIKSNHKEGLTELEYFISTHGSRKGKSDTALRTSDAGYLTRRLVDVAQDMVVNSHDCGSKEGINVNRSESDQMNLTFTSRIIGRTSAQTIKDPKTNKVIAKSGEEINEKAIELIELAGITDVIVRSVMSCNNEYGTCQLCYGRDLSTGKLVNIGEAVGIMAAQAIGEPGTQLTLKTFHMGGVSGEDITTGLPRVEELFEARVPRTPAVMAEIAGVARISEDKNKKIITIESNELPTETYTLESDYSSIVKDGDLVKAKQAIAVSQGKKAFRSRISGIIKLQKSKITVTANEKIAKEYIVPANANIKIQDKDIVNLGDELTEGHLDLALALKLRGKTSAQKYIIKGIQDIYNSQGQSINDKHIEIMLSQMFSKVYIKDGGDSLYLPGQIVDQFDIEQKNLGLIKNKKQPIFFDNIILGVTRIALKTESFLSAASFQETTSVLIDAAIRGTRDNLRGLKENVIIGRLIPAGTGYKKTKS